MRIIIPWLTSTSNMPTPATALGTAAKKEPSWHSKGARKTKKWQEAKGSVDADTLPDCLNRHSDMHSCTLLAFSMNVFVLYCGQLPWFEDSMLNALLGYGSRRSERLIIA